MEVTVCPIFLPRVPLMNPRTLWACQDVACMISARVAPLARRNNARTAAVLLPGRTPSGFGWVAFWGALASFLARVVFLVDWGLEGATRRAGLADGAFVGGFGSGFSPSAWIRLQIRPAADLTLWKPFTGSTPGRLFQISAKRSGGQAEASSVSCFWLVKGWEQVPTAASAWSGVGNAVHLIDQEVGVRYHAGHVWKLLRQLNWSPQRPAGRALERNEEAIREWKRKTWPAIKKSPKRRSHDRLHRRKRPEPASPPLPDVGAPWSNARIAVSLQLENHLSGGGHDALEFLLSDFRQGRWQGRNRGVSDSSAPAHCGSVAA